MKAIEFSAFGIDHLQLVERSEPRLQANEVLVKIEAVSLNYLDLALVRGHYKPDLPLPAVPTSDGAGVVVRVGQQVTQWRPGDRVMVQFKQKWIAGNSTPETIRVSVGVNTPGVLAERVALPDYGLVRIPDYLTSEEASTLPIAGLTAWAGLVEQGKLRIGQTVLTQGTGGVSVAALQLAKAAGARVIATTSSEEKAEKLKALGADWVINYKQTPDWDRQVQKLTGGLGVDVTLDVAGAETLSQSMNAVKLHGTVVVVGMLAGIQAPFNVLTAIQRAVQVKGISVGSREAFEAYTKALESNQIKPVVDRVFTLEQTREAFHYLASGRHFGKVVIRL